MARKTLWDFNNDGRVDLLWLSLSGITLTGYYGFTTTTASPSWNYIGYADPAWAAYGVGNFTGGASGADMLFVNESTRSFGYWQIDNGGVQSWQGLGSYAAGWQPLHIADFTGDGVDDVMFANFSTGQVGSWDVNANGTLDWRAMATFTPGSNIPGLPSNWLPMTAGDFSGDGIADVFWYNQLTGQTGIYQNNTQGAATWVTYGALGTIPISAGWQPILAADVNGDRNDDVVWYNRFNNSVGIWDLDSGAVQWTQFGSGGAGWVLTGVGDYTGDGAADFLWAQTSTGNYGYWEMDAGGVYNTWVSLGTDQPGDQWSLAGPLALF